MGEGTGLFLHGQQVLTAPQLFFVVWISLTVLACGIDRMWDYYRYGK